MTTRTLTLIPARHWLTLMCIAGALLFLTPDAWGQPLGHELTQPPDTITLGGLLSAPRWSPYLVGIGIGILSWLAFLLSDHPLGISTAYARSAGMIEVKVRGDKARERAYYREYKPIVDWEWMLLVGLFVGAWLSATLSGSFRVEMVPAMWETAFGSGVVIRWLTALAGGFLLGLGARWANGCTSGHGISGCLQLVVSSWVAVLCFFVGGVATAFVLYAVIA